MSTTTIGGLDTRGTVLDNTVFATETAGITEKITAASIKNYVSSLTNITTSGLINAAGGLVSSTVFAGTIGNTGAILTGTLSTSLQPNITRVGTLSGLSVTGNILLNGARVWSAASAASFARIDSTPIGNLVPSTGQFTSITASNAIINGAISASGGTYNTLVATNMRASGSFQPTANLVSSLGLTSLWFNTAYINSAQIRTANVPTVNSVTIGTTNLTAATINVTSSLLPNANVARNIGSPTLRFNDVYAADAILNTLTSTTISASSGTLTTAGITTLTATNATVSNITVSTSLVPSSNLSVNLGSTTRWFNNIYGKSIQAQYADLAEVYKSDEIYEPGTVVVFGGEYEITISNESHTPAVAGVISTNPAYLMNATQPGLPVALSGRVPCRVRGPVNKGDRLVNAGAGVAAVLDPAKYQPGCVIGHSLSNITSDEVAVIEVVVMKF
jgi:hypothetical protein